MRRLLFLLLLFAALLAPVAVWARADAELPLNAGQSVYTPAGTLRFWVDSNPASTFGDADAALLRGDFARTESRRPAWSI